MLRAWFLVVVLVVGATLGLSTEAAAQGCSAAPAADWRTTLAFSNDPFVVTPSNGEPRWVKFTILLCDPGTVYFQDSRAFPYHYGFARARLGPFLGMTDQQFDAATLHAAGQQAVLGAVLLPGFVFGEPGGPADEWAIQLVRQDAYTKEQVRGFFDLVRSKVTGAAGTTALYFPSYEQAASAEADSAWLLANGVPVSSPARWIGGSRCYAQGWALGTLKFVPGSEIAAAFTAGTLRAEDILLTDGVPAEVPPVAGILSLSPSTPSSHVAILSATYGVPFAFLTGPDAAVAQALVGRRVIVRAYEHGAPGVAPGACNASVVDVQGLLSPEMESQILELKDPPPLAYAPATARGVYALNTDGLHPADTRFVGGKAANYGFLRRAIPANSRPAVGLTFDSWNEFMSQTPPGLGGRTLRQEIAARLAPFSSWPVADQAGLSAALGGVRTLITSANATAFPATAQAGVLAALQDPAYGFDPDLKIRCRSSTNVEDSSQFTGAGLYESFSGCLADELDADTTGPSRCDPAEANERGIFRALRRVYASFYYDNAYLARLRYGVDETRAGMAVLCHHSFPDETEMANGVAILGRAGSHTTISIVSQVGAVSVSNPEDGTLPEEVEVEVHTFGLFPELRRASNLVQLGATVMDWEDDYRGLAQLLIRVADAFGAETGRGTFTLDFEFKKTAPGGELEVKQVRELPVPGTTPSVTPVLVHNPTRYCLFQGEYGDVFANHRLKAAMTLSTDSRWLAPANLQTSFFGPTSSVFSVGCRVGSLEGRPDSWPAAQHSFVAGGSIDRWRVAGPGVTNPRTYTLLVPDVPTLVAPSRSPILFIEDLGRPYYASRGMLELRAEYDRPVPSLDWNEQPVLVTSESAWMCPCPPARSGPPQQETFTGPGGVSITTAYRWTPIPGGIVAGYTADLASFEGTTIRGLTTVPITLRGLYSQTYRPGHHNFSSDFIFEPRLEPGISRLQLQELRNRGVAFILARGGQSLFEPLTFYADDCMPCPVDFDQSGAVGIPDVFAFLTAWFADDGRGDFDGVGGTTVADLFVFLGAWFAGC